MKREKIVKQEKRQEGARDEEEAMKIAGESLRDDSRGMEKESERERERERALSLYLSVRVDPKRLDSDRIRPDPYLRPTLFDHAQHLT